MNFIIIDDEPDGRLFLQEIMLRYFDKWKLLGVGASVSEGINAIKMLKPDLVLLDVEIGEGTGFDILNAIENPTFQVIFITAHQHYAMKAIKYAALDYLLKPVNVDDLGEALKKIEKESDAAPRLEVLKQNLAHNSAPSNIMIHTHRGYNLVAIDEIAYLEAHGQYVYVNLTDKRKILASRSLGYYEELLGENIFFRVHKSFLVNVSKVVRIVTNPSPKVELHNGTLIDLAFRRKEAFVALLKNVNTH